jgi:hypothetical protein
MLPLSVPLSKWPSGSGALLRRSSARPQSMSDMRAPALAESWRRWQRQPMRAH